MNHCIHDRAGLNQFYIKFMPLLVHRTRISALVSRPYVDGLSISVGLHDAGTSLVDHCYFAELALVSLPVVWLKR